MGATKKRGQEGLSDWKCIDSIYLCYYRRFSLLSSFRDIPPREGLQLFPILVTAAWEGAAAPNADQCRT